MKKIKYTEEQIAFVLKQVELGAPVLDVCRKMGITEQTFYRWKKKYAILARCTNGVMACAGDIGHMTGKEAIEYVNAKK